MFSGFPRKIHMDHNFGFANRMSDSSSKNKVLTTTPRVARWWIDDMPLGAFQQRSNPFKIGKWNWQLSLYNFTEVLVRLCPMVSTDSSPVASFIIRVINFQGVVMSMKQTEMTVDKLKDMVWNISTPLARRAMIEVRFFDLKTESPNGGEPLSIWAKELCKEATLSTFGRMLTEGIHTDIVIETSDGSIGAHRAVLSSRSPVFRSMFSHGFKEKELSTIEISDMSMEECQTFLNYIYGNIEYDNFLMHLPALFRAADKYDITDLKETCLESLSEDIDMTNALERLQTAHLYQLPNLKKSCLEYLVKFGSIHIMRDELNAFVLSADRDLIAEVFQEVLNSCTGSLNKKTFGF